MHRHIVFDLDGTLADTLPGIATGLNRALANLGLTPHAESAVRGMIGRGARNLCAQALGYRDAQEAPPALLDKLHENFRLEYPHCWQGEASLPYPGIAGLLHELNTLGARLGILSNKPHDVTHPMVKQLFGQVEWGPIRGYTGQFPRKPAPDALLHIAEEWEVAAHEITLVGDSLYDANTAKNAGCRLVLVSWGYAVLRDLEATGEPIAHTVDELRQLLINEASA